ncbi:hypothetical protein [Candidatus Enterococcus murrayae]|uniref:Pre-toxin TG domain-containing protein n=1 Tax=Candidatus Enterococcus murrayae TaxID=2815321 RepID=A0ABS3HBW6_9ENTE|nr:hypothetical protein [Enterococcus sp. MJM16]MBO0450954.1 hypothetical protein [Enterococcus sp. MJM16]
MSYTSPEALTIFQDKKFKKQIDKEHTKVKGFEQPKMAAKVRKANNHGLAQTSMYYGVDKTEINQVGQGINWVAGVSGNKPENTRIKEVQGVITDIELNALEEYGGDISKWFLNNSYKMGNKAFSVRIGNQVFPITSASAIYSASSSGVKVIGSASKGAPIIGSVIDYDGQRSDGENAQAAMDKTLIHAGAVVGSIFVAASAPAWLVVIGTGVSISGVGKISDAAYDAIQEKGKK